MASTTEGSDFTGEVPDRVQQRFPLGLQYVRQVALSSITSVFIQLRNFLLLPLLVKFLGFAQYGIWVQLSAFINIIAPLATLGLSGSMDRFLPGLDSRQTAKQFSPALSCVGIVAALCGVAVAAGAEEIASLLFRDLSYAGHFQLMGAVIFISAVENFVRSYFRAKRRVKIFSILSLLEAFGFVGLAALSSYYGYAVFGVLLGILCIRLGTATLSLCFIFREIDWVLPQLQLLKEQLKFGLPLLPVGMFIWVMQLSDRYVIGYFNTDEAVGIYSTAYMLCMVCSLYYSPIYLILGPTLTEQWERGQQVHVNTYLSLSLKYGWLLSVPTAVALAVLADPLMILLSGSRVHISPLLIAAVGGGIVAAMTSYGIEEILRLRKNTRMISVIYGLSALMNLVLNFIMVPWAGMLGAALATLATYLFRLAFVYLYVKSVFALALEWKNLLKSSVAAIGMVWTLVFIAPERIAGVILASLVGALVYCLILLLQKSFAPEEFQFWKMAVSTKLGWDKGG